MTATDDPVLAAVQRFMDAVEVRIGTLTGETRSLLTDARSALAEMQTRAAAPAGKDGAPGRDGVDGKDGRDGKDGERGEQGARGEPGERGADGIAGRDGAASTVPGPRGEQGERGEPGERGIDGLAGRDGAPGERGADGLIGPVGPAGDRGERGADGLAGRDGAPGPRGEQGERGADGIATLEELDARIEARFAELQVRTFADVYQGVYEPNKVYGRGLLATWGGSLWLSQNSTHAKPGENGDWKLVVKRGADGRK